jgi:cell division septum initiation protein DivIVA
MSRTLTLQQLVEHGACASQRSLFAAAFGAAVEVTEALALQHAATFTWGWAARLLSSAGCASYQRATDLARAEYERATDLAWAEYERAKALALAEYERATAPALAEYERATAPAWAEYERATDLARAEYERAKAPAWAAAYIADRTAEPPKIKITVPETGKTLELNLPQK